MIASSFPSLQGKTQVFLHAVVTGIMHSAQYHLYVVNCPATQVLYSSEGYTYLDVRPKLENEEVGRVRNSVNIPMVNLKRVWDPEQKKKILQKEDNEHFIDQASPTPLFSEDCQRRALLGTGGRRLSCCVACLVLSLICSTLMLHDPAV